MDFTLSNHVFDGVKFLGRGQGNSVLIAGFSVSMFTFCEFLAGITWARVSAITGRKTMLLIAAFAAMILSISFELCGSVFAAVAIRERIPMLEWRRFAFEEIAQKRKDQDKSPDYQPPGSGSDCQRDFGQEELSRRAVSPSRTYERED